VTAEEVAADAFGNALANGLVAKMGAPDLGTDPRLNVDPILFNGAQYADEMVTGAMTDYKLQSQGFGNLWDGSVAGGGQEDSPVSESLDEGGSARNGSNAQVQVSSGQGSGAGPIGGLRSLGGLATAAMPDARLNSLAELLAHLPSSSVFGPWVDGKVQDLLDWTFGDADTAYARAQAAVAPAAVPEAPASDGVDPDTALMVRVQQLGPDADSGDVTAAQQVLAQGGYLPSSGVDGQYGRHTGAAIAQWLADPWGDGTQAPASGGPFGFVSRFFESGNNGVATISSGADDPGGVSYGTFQLSSAAGTMGAFLASPEGQPYAGNFTGLTPGTAQFNGAYNAVVNNDAQAFSAAQTAYMTRTSYNPVAQYAADSELDTSDPPVREALFSQAVQHSYAGNKVIIDNAAATLPDDATVDQQVQALYAARASYVQGLSSLSATTKQTIIARYQSERAYVESTHR
jgi:hypothetical protein